MLKCSCRKCGAIVPGGVENHFIAEDGRILCDKCSMGVKPVSSEMYEKLLKIERNECNE